MRLFAPFVVGSALLAAVSAHAEGIDWQKVDAAMGRNGVVSGEVHRYAFPREDLEPTVDGISIRPALAFVGWIAFKPMHTGAMAMGDLVLVESELNAVITKLIGAGLEVTALHNHLLRASPSTYYLHVGGHGDPEKMAAAIHAALALSGTPLEASAAPQAASVVGLDVARIDQVIGVKGQANGGVYQISVPRSGPIKMDGLELSPAGPMGVATGINFQPTGDGKAAVTGDFVLTGDEVNPVVAALRANGIEVTAIHSHMLTEQPRLFFLHFWANDDVGRLAKGLRAAIDRTAHKGAPG